MKVIVRTRMRGSADLQTGARMGMKCTSLCMHSVARVHGNSEATDTGCKDKYLGRI